MAYRSYEYSLFVLATRSLQLMSIDTISLCYNSSPQPLLISTHSGLIESYNILGMQSSQWFCWIGLRYLCFNSRKKTTVRATLRNRSLPQRV